MGHTAQLEPTAAPAAAVDVRPRREPRFHILVLADYKAPTGRRGATLLASILVHSLLVAAIVIVPLLVQEALPSPPDMIHTFFVSPPEVAPPPPPPPPPPPGAKVRANAPAPAPVPSAPATFTAPIEVPEAVVPEAAGIDLGGVEGGVPGGVEGGVPGGVVGGIVGGLPLEPPPQPKVVRIGGRLVAPKLLRMIPPVYPDLALQSRLTALITLEAHVDTHGTVVNVKVLQGHPLFDDAAIAAVRQWRYQPLLLNGIPTEFLVAVTVRFNLTAPGQ
jgi:protein TonB